MKNIAGNLPSWGYGRRLDAHFQADGILALHTVANPDLFNLQASIINGARGQIFQPPFECPAPATECKWSNIRTLGICRNIRDVSHTTTFNCTGSTTVQLNCTYIIPNRNEEDNDPVNLTYSYDSNVGNQPKTTLFRSVAGSGQQAGSLTTVRVINPMVPKAKITPPDTEIFYTTFYWCEKIYSNITSTSGLLHINDLPTQNRLSADGTPISTVTSDGHKDPNNTLNAEYFSLTSNQTNVVYNITRATLSFIFDYISILFDTTALDTSENRGPPDRSVIDLAQYFLYNDITNITQNVADSLTNQLRGGRSQVGNDIGDNANATISDGETYWNETYVKVRWPWLIIPLVETVLVSALLIVTIWISWGEVLFKSSVAALLVHGLEGWTADELIVGTHETAEKLEKVFQGMEAKFEKDETGVLKFMKL